MPLVLAELRANGRRRGVMRSMFGGIGMAALRLEDGDNCVVSSGYTNAETSELVVPLRPHWMHA